MKYGFVMPSGDARTAADLAVELEAAGWDALFVWEPVWGVDAWVSLTAAAMVTERLRLGTMLTPPSSMRPSKLASETATLDNLSGGRVILSVGLGAPEVGYEQFGEVTDRKQRAALTDEALEIITALWRGEPFEHRGEHYAVQLGANMPTGKPAPPVQQPRIPIWVVGAWPAPKSMARVLKYDGFIPTARDDSGGYGRQPAPDEIREMKAWLAERGDGRTHDIIIEGGNFDGDVDAERKYVRGYEAAGATWYVSALWDLPGKTHTRDDIFAFARRGPLRD
jgi:hypothetical protein